MNHTPEHSGVAGHTFTIDPDYEDVNMTSRAMWIDCLSDIVRADGDFLTASLARAEGFLINLQIAGSIDAYERERLERALETLVERRVNVTPHGEV
ncbi:hypothetical protein [Pseudomonas syringae]|uniref:hypothetical protein n=1 Tax=Pseudomonas syringae TaxID=317 RepID=UPI0006CB65D5|nr:hypothetical protein [Pseudomonas syringae]ALE01102.1 hypothetical protein PSYRMG_25865 [Pseudomonas syringae UMAF0158]MCK9694774.1 hypothetical protein [Pseudomonas syringae pv. syringae]MCK9709736.1 hypothetical protein [Pseudomonas syringae pv. syringae]MCK9729964.1 hypothetical protein [Pseudomonas syringae pv. syringae]MCK9734946.1 hypothetical protein [Pseudomonas syringae pv. syringae]